MINLSNLGVMQGRLSPPYKNKIQHFPLNNWQREFKIAKSLNLKCIQWVYELENYQLNPLYNEPKSIKEMRNLTGVSVNSVILDYFMEKKLFNENDETLKKNFEHLEFIINQCEKASIKILELPFVDNSSLKKLRDKNIFINDIKKILKKIEKKDILISFETDLDPLSFLDLIKKFCPFKIFVNYDMGNSTSNNFNADEELKILGKYILNVHIKDRISNYGTTVPLGEGNTNFVKIFKNLNKINYDGDYILQCARKDLIGEKKNLNPSATIQHYISFLENIK